MPVFDGTNVDEGEDFKPLPTDDYPAEIISIEETATRALDPMWKVKLKVINHEYAGRQFFDNWVWNDKTENRIKRILHRFGFDTEQGPVNYNPDMFYGRTALVTVLEDTYEKDGKQIPTNTVPFAGYDYYDNGNNDTPREDGDLDPF